MTPRLQLLDLLVRHQPLGDEETEMTARAIRFAQMHEECLSADFAPGHITGSAWVLDPARRLVLLTHHRKLDRWFQLGGHLEPGETAGEGALREAREESGLADVRLPSDAIFDVDIHPIPARGATPGHDHYDIRFLCIADASAPLIASSESRALAWVALDEVAGYNASESIQRMARKTNFDGFA